MLTPHDTDPTPPTAAADRETRLADAGTPLADAKTPLVGSAGGGRR
jgi:hypothetical protein